MGPALRRGCSVMKLPTDWDLHDVIPSFRARLANEKKIHVYYIPGKDRVGQPTYLYAVASASLHAEFMESVTRFGEVPDFAVIVQIGYGEPSEDVKKKMSEYYGYA